MAADKRELILDLLARDKSGPATASFGKKIADVGDKAERAGKQSEAFGKKTEAAGKGADSLGDQAGQAARGLAKLDREAEQAKRELEKLALAFAAADSAADRLDVSKQINKVNRDLSKIGKNKGILEKLLPDPEPAAKNFFGKFTSALGSGASSLASAGGPGALIGAAIGAGALPAISATISTSLSAALGVAGLGAGVALAIRKDTGVQEAAKSIGKRFVDTLSDSASKSFAGPLRSSLGILDDLAGRSASKIGKLFAGLAPTLVPLTRDIAQVGDRLVDMLVNVAEDSGPAIEGLGDSIRLLVDGVADFVEEVADGGADTAAVFTAIAGAVADTLRFTGKLINSFTQFANSPWSGLLGTLVAHYQKVSDESDKLVGSNTEVAHSFTNAEKAARGEISAMKALSDELRAQTDPVFGLLKAQDDLADAQSKVAKETKKHGANSREAKAALRELAGAAIDLEGKVGELGGSFNGTMTPALRSTLQAAGLTKSQIARLEQQFREAKKAGGDFARTYTARAKVNGASAARASLYSVRDAANDIPRAVTISMRITGTTNVSKAISSINKQYARASGGPVNKNVPYWVGEQGPELILPNENGMVLNAMQSARFARSVGPGTGGATVAPGGGGGTLRLELVGQQEIVTMFRYLVRTANLLQG